MQDTGDHPQGRGMMTGLPEGYRASCPEDLFQGWCIKHLSGMQDTGKHPRGRGSMHQTPCRMSGITSQGLSPECWVAESIPGDRTLCPGHFTEY